MAVNIRVLYNSWFNKGVTEEPDRLAHYRSFSLSSISAQQRKEALAQVLRERKAKHDADEETRERLYTTRHAARMEDFRNQISRDDRFNDEEKANIIKASREWW